MSGTAHVSDNEVDWQGKARARWRDNEWVDGDGPVALVAHCQCITIQLYETVEEAQIGKGRIDRSGCGSRCIGAGGHEVIDMRTNQRGNAHCGYEHKEELD